MFLDLISFDVALESNEHVFWCCHMWCQFLTILMESDLLVILPVIHGVGRSDLDMLGGAAGSMLVELS